MTINLPPHGTSLTTTFSRNNTTYSARGTDFQSSLNSQSNLNSITTDNNSNDTFDELNDNNSHNVLHELNLTTTENSGTTRSLSKQQKIQFFMNHHVKTIFIGLVALTLFKQNIKLITNRENAINHQGANSKISYYAVTIPPITKVIKNIPYYQFDSKKYWTLIKIKPSDSWMKYVSFFSITPYIGTYNVGSQNEKEYLANVNVSFNSILLKGNNPNIYQNKESIQLIYTFSTVFQKLLHDPKNNVYAYLLPGDQYDISNFTFMCRFEKIDNLTNSQKLRLAAAIKKNFNAFTFSDFPFQGKANGTTTHNNLSGYIFDHYSNSTQLKNTLEYYPKINTDYENNKIYINEFITKSKQYNSTHSPFKIYPYFYLRNNNHVVTNFYQLQESDSDCNALINDYNKNYYNSEIITIRNEAGSSLNYTSLKVLALNHVNSGYATTCNIQVYDVSTQKSLETFNSSSNLPSINSVNYPDTTYSVTQTKGIYEFDIDLTKTIYENTTQISVFERICYPPCTVEEESTTNSSYIKNSGPRYTSFKIITDNPEIPENSSVTDSQEIVNEKYVYTIQSNDSEYSLHKNFNVYSTMNLRVYDTTADGENISEDTTSGTTAPASEAPASEATASEAPASEAPASEATASEAPASEATASEAPASEATASEAPASEATASEAPASEATASEAPASEATASEAPASEATASEAPASEATASEAPASEATGEYIQPPGEYITDFINMDADEAKEIILNQYSNIVDQVWIVPSGSQVIQNYQLNRVRLYVNNLDDKIVQNVEAPGVPEINTV